MRSPDALWGEFRSALQFPHWFGRNWEALRESLRDLDWDRRRSYLLVVTNAHDMLADERDHGLADLAALLESVAEELSREHQQSFDERRPPTPFHVLLHVDVAETPAWEGRLEAAGLEMAKLPIRDPASWE